MDFKSQIINGQTVAVLRFKVPRKARRKVRSSVKSLTFAHIQEVRTFKESAFTLTYIGSNESSNLEFIRDRFESIAI